MRISANSEKVYGYTLKAFSHLDLCDMELLFQGIDGYQVRLGEKGDLRKFYEVYLEKKQSPQIIPQVSGVNLNPPVLFSRNSNTVLQKYTPTVLFPTTVDHHRPPLHAEPTRSQLQPPLALPPSPVPIVSAAHQNLYYGSIKPKAKRFELIWFIPILFVSGIIWYLLSGKPQPSPQAATSVNLGPKQTFDFQSPVKLGGRPELPDNTTGPTSYPGDRTSCGQNVCWAYELVSNGMAFAQENGLHKVPTASGEDDVRSAAIQFIAQHGTQGHQPETIALHIFAESIITNPDGTLFVVSQSKRQTYVIELKRDLELYQSLIGGRQP